jgi:HlyD family secretion protein
MLIVPEGDALVIEAKVAPQDIDHVRQGQLAFIRFTAFDQNTTPEFQGKVTRVSADLTKDAQTGVSYYVVRLALIDGAQANIPKTTTPATTVPDVAATVANRQSRGSHLALIPGMPAEVHIRTGERTAVSYFLKPLRDQIARAFTER